jgi:hypothetical protein
MYLQNIQEHSPKGAAISMLIHRLPFAICNPYNLDVGTSLVATLTKKFVSHAKCMCRHPSVAPGKTAKYY